MSVIAVVFDYDDTLVPDSTSALLRAHDIDLDEFWTDLVPGLVRQGYDPPLAYLRVILDHIGPGQPLGALTNANLQEFGRSLDTTYFPGIPELFADLRRIVAAHEDLVVEFYIISGGLKDLIAGSEIVANNMTGVYGCQLGEDLDAGYIRYIKRCITFTEKTRYLFEINKGVQPSQSDTQPELVNLRKDDRRVPFANMVYVGDGLTDVPCFSLVQKNGGTPFGVFKSGAESARQAFQKLLATDRVKGLHSPDYRADADLGAMIRAAVETCAARIALQQEQPYA